ncbi:M23 family metallopeptidase [Microlunatus flavus]|uniref:M23 family metallopeptidase n=1 Tax=Microlunatus flavus TaxID=1036181 RepID=UPI000B8342B1|nr:M23 family metallopeptidase [Microlunatus flavus]
MNKRGWLQHGVAAMAVSVLGLGVAGSFALTGNAQDTGAAHDQTAGTAAVAGPGTAARDSALTSRSSNRAPLDPAKVKSIADQRAEELAKTDDKISAAAAGKKVDQREKELAETSDAAQEQARRIADDKKNGTSTAKDDQPAADANQGAGNGKTCEPAAHYRIAATFGQVGSWARYHTGFDFAAPIGTTLRAPASGVVTNAGRGPASGWAGNYVAIKYPDGTQSLMAHMSTVSVSVGQQVSGCQTVGAVGMTGRTFGPHVHFEIYPAGITPGDVYRAVNPLGWLKAHGLNP